MRKILKARAVKWSAEEDQLLTLFYPDYRKIQRRLTKRTYSSMRHRARKLGIATRRHIWTGLEEKKLRKLHAAGATRSEITSAFPHLNWHQTSGKARHIRLGRPRRVFCRLGIPPLDSVRQQVAARGLTLRELDRLAKTGRYFQKTTRRVDWKCLASAVEKLGGTIKIAWKSDDE